jgi:hypothetical protein
MVPPSCSVDRQRHRLVLNHATPPFDEADKLIAVVENPLADNGAYHRIESGAVSAAGQNSNSHFDSSPLLNGFAHR